MVSSAPLFDLYVQPSVSFTHGEGCWLFDTQGRSYLDFCAGIAVTSLGHAHPALVEALQDQVAKLWHVSNLFRIEEQHRVAEALVRHSFADRVFFCNSGLEAIEAGLKLARRYWFCQGETEKWRFVALHGGFHGRSLGGLAAAGNARLLEGFGPPMPGFTQVALSRLEASLDPLRELVGPQTAGLILEPVQGEGGVHPVSPALLRALEHFAREHRCLLILDEIQCGLGRTGAFLCHEHAAIRPDIVALAKGLGGGFPVGALLATEKVSAGFTPGSHGSTFGGNFLAMRAAETVLSYFDRPEFLDSIRARGQRLAAGLDSLTRDFPDIYPSRRGLGLMQGLVCTPPLADLRSRCLEAGLLTAPAAGNVIRLLPPLIVSDDEIQLAVAKLARVAASFSGAPASAASAAVSTGFAGGSGEHSGES